MCKEHRGRLWRNLFGCTGAHRAYIFILERIRKPQLQGDSGRGAAQSQFSSHRRFNESGAANTLYCIASSPLNLDQLELLVDQGLVHSGTRVLQSPINRDRNRVGER